MKLKLVIAKDSAGRHSAWQWPAALTERLRRDFPQVEIEECSLNADRDTAAATAATAFTMADAAIAWRIPGALIANAPRLRWVHAPSAAVHEMLTPELLARRIVLTHGSAVHAPAVAEHALALMLALARGLPQAMRQQSESLWRTLPAEAGDAAGVSELRGATALLVGVGHIGQLLAPWLATLGMQVWGIRRHPERSAAGCAAMHGPEKLEALLPQADYVVLAAPVTGDTRTLLDAERLALLRPTARLINVGRGALVDEAALAAALQAGRLAGAGLDVFMQEPLPPGSPLWACERALITPHIAGISPHTWNRQFALIATNLRHFLQGEPLQEVVDLTLGY